ncbi:O-methyltransferase [Capnocytophaga sp. oral taxon 863 str. F0517]|uniref:O-methyltransferase n=1 Tax=Capnocytophaga sp. oral taxon 863 TaxID=1227265 RepID=UPI000396A315|nr:O-methyltransferase [Capnocytophaga sp. oral taxon 863]ERI62789.1 O-methyltransferase [Capnocytophaga sp. oral taxon 863 str. F0517]
MHFLSADLQHYAEAHSQAEPPLLAALSRETHLRVLQPRMLSGLLQGRLLSLLSKLLSPSYIVEIGTFTGYATLCLAEGLPPEGVLHTIEANEEYQPIQDKYFQQSPYHSQIVQHFAPALEVLPSLPDGIELVFIDADKKNYLNYLEAILPKMRPGGVILSDNVLWSGKVVEAVKDNDKHTQILMEYNQRLATDPRLETVLLPIRDGISLARVKG